MGEVEQQRMNTPETVKLDTLAFVPDEEIEATLRRDLATAQRNLNRYLARKAYVIDHAGEASDRIP